jgi:hypothetical protein
MEETVFLESIDSSVEEGLDFPFECDPVSYTESEVLRNVYQDRDS